MAESPERDANARLIAAAPDLLTACRSMMQLMMLIPFAEQPDLRPFQNAIDKATGST